MISAQQISIRITELVWQTPPSALGPGQRVLQRAARVIYALSRDLSSGQLTLQAMSLVYTTLLSLVPLLAVSFSVLKGFGVHNQLEPLLLRALAPLGPQGQEIAERLIGYVDNTKVGVLGSLGLALLLYSVITLISKIEQVFNLTWRVEKPRPLTQRLSQYLSVLLVGPVLFFSAVGATASLRSAAIVQRIIEIEPFGMLIETGGRLIPYALIILAFAFAYLFVPNTRVRARSALIGALVAGVLWQTVGGLFATFMSSAASFAAIYSSLAILILFMIWVYIAWLILLTGANIAFYDQYPEYLASPESEPALSNRLREHAALTIASRIAASHYQGTPAWSAERLSHAMAMPLSNVRRLLAMLEQGRYLTRTADDPPYYLPLRAPETIAVSDLLDYVRHFGENGAAMDVDIAGGKLEEIERRIAEATRAALQGVTLADLVAAGTADDPKTTRLAAKASREPWQGRSFEGTAGPKPPISG